LNHDPFPYFQKLAQLLNQNKPADSIRERIYTLKKLKSHFTFPNYKDIRKVIRKFAYKLRNLFGTGFKITFSNNYSILPNERS